MLHVTFTSEQALLVRILLTDYAAVCRSVGGDHFEKEMTLALDALTTVRLGRIEGE